MDDNFNNSSMAGKVVSVLIALLFIVVLAFPIANSLGNTDNGGSENIGEEVNNLQELWANDGIQTDFKSYEVYRKDISEGIDKIITLDDLKKGEIISASNIDILHLDFSEKPYTDDRDAVYLYVECKDSVRSVRGNIINPSFKYTFDELDSMTLTLKKDWTCDILIVPSDAESIHYVGQYYSASWLSNDANGWGVAWNFDNLHVKDGSRLIMDWLIHDTQIYSREISYSTLLIFDSSNVIDGIMQYQLDVTIEGVHIQDTVPLRFTQIEGTDEYLIGEPDAWGYIVDESYSSETINGDSICEWVSLYNSDPYADSGSGSNIGGVASTLIKLVPILLIVSLLMVFIVPMVYKPN